MPETPLDAYLVAVAEREKAATKGPWRTNLEAFPNRIRIGDSREIVVHDRRDLNYFDGWQVQADTTFVAEGRTDLPRLLRLVREAVEIIRLPSCQCDAIGCDTCKREDAFLAQNPHA